MPDPPHTGAFPPADARTTIPHVPGRQRMPHPADTEEVTAMLQVPPPRFSRPQAPPLPSAPPPPLPPTPPTPAAGLPKVCSTCGKRYPAEVFLCLNDSMPLVADGPLPEPVDPLIGQLLNDTFQVVRLVGEGGMGKVYEARHTRLKDRRFAIKVLLPEFAQNPELVARFQREAESASSISHPNVVEVIDVFHTRDGAPCIAAEFLDGEELGAFVDKVGRLGVPFAIGVARQICRALAAAHAQGVVHRDMKPENVFLLKQLPGESGVPRIKVIDFGVSRVKDHDIHLTQAGVILGTPSFMAPEQARAEVVDERADIYGVGAVLYNLLTGVRPFDADDPTRTLIMLLTEELAPARSINPAIPPALDAVMRRCLAKNRAERYGTMKELEDALAPFDADAVRPPSPSFSQMAPMPQRQSAPPPPAYPAPRPSQDFMAAEPSATLPAEATTVLGMVALILGAGHAGALTARRVVRPQVIAFGAVYVWLAYTALVHLLLGVARLVMGEGAFDGVGSLVFLHIFAVGLSVVAAALAAQHVREKMWDDYARLEPFAQDLRAGVLLSLFGMSGVLGLARWLGVALLGDREVTFSAGWDVLVFMGGALGVLGFIVRRMAFKGAPQSPPHAQPQRGPFG